MTTVRIDVIVTDITAWRDDDVWLCMHVGASAEASKGALRALGPSVTLTKPVDLGVLEEALTRLMSRP